MKMQNFGHYIGEDNRQSLRSFQNHNFQQENDSSPYNTNYKENLPNRPRKPQSHIPSGEASFNRQPYMIMQHNAASQMSSRPLSFDHSNIIHSTQASNNLNSANIPQQYYNNDTYSKMQNIKENNSGNFNDQSTISPEYYGFNHNTPIRPPHQFSEQRYYQKNDENQYAGNGFLNNELPKRPPNILPYPPIQNPLYLSYMNYGIPAPVGIPEMQMAPWAYPQFLAPRLNLPYINQQQANGYADQQRRKSIQNRASVILPDIYQNANNAYLNQRRKSIPNQSSPVLPNIFQNNNDVYSDSRLSLNSIDSYRSRVEPKFSIHQHQDPFNTKVSKQRALTPSDPPRASMTTSQRYRNYRIPSEMSIYEPYTYDEYVSLKEKDKNMKLTGGIGIDEERRKLEADKRAKMSDYSSKIKVKRLKSPHTSESGKKKFSNAEVQTDTENEVEDETKSIAKNENERKQNLVDRKKVEKDLKATTGKIEIIEPLIIHRPPPKIISKKIDVSGVQPKVFTGIRKKSNNSMHSINDSPHISEQNIVISPEILLDVPNNSKRMNDLEMDSITKMKLESSDQDEQDELRTKKSNIKSNFSLIFRENSCFLQFK